MPTGEYSQEAVLARFGFDIAVGIEEYLRHFQDLLQLDSRRDRQAASRSGT